MKVAFVGGLWSRNIGNSYYNLGATAFFRKIPFVDAYFIPDPPQWEDPHVTTNFDLIASLDVDIVLLMGPCLNLRLRPIYENTFKALRHRRIPFGFVSAGMSLYDSGEANSVADLLSQYSPQFIYTRDELTANLLSSAGLKSVYSGICLSFYLNEAISLPSLDFPPYAALGFDEREPNIGGNRNSGFYLKSSAHKRRLLPQKSFASFIDNLPIVRLRNDSTLVSAQHLYRRPNSYHSDIPYGYLTLIKNAEFVITERVHTCAAALSLGTPAQYLPYSARSSEKRLLLFDSVGLSSITKHPLLLDKHLITDKKHSLEERVANSLLAV